MMLQSGNNRPLMRPPAMQWSGAYRYDGRRRVVREFAMMWTESRHWAAGYRSVSCHKAGEYEACDVTVQGAEGIDGGWNMSRQGQQ